MKKVELRQIIKEEIQRLNESGKSVSNEEILDLVDHILDIIKRLKKQDSIKSKKLWTLSNPFLKELYKFLYN